MSTVLKSLISDLSLLRSKIKDDDIKLYLENKAKEFYLNINDQYDRESLKNDLFNSYVIRTVLNIKEDKEYFTKIEVLLKKLGVRNS